MWLKSSHSISFWGNKSKSICLLRMNLTKNQRGKESFLLGWVAKWTIKVWSKLHKDDHTSSVAGFKPEFWKPDRFPPPPPSFYPKWTKVGQFSVSSSLHLLFQSSAGVCWAYSSKPCLFSFTQWDEIRHLTLKNCGVSKTHSKKSYGGAVWHLVSLVVPKLSSILPGSPLHSSRAVCQGFK